MKDRSRLQDLALILPAAALLLLLPPVLALFDRGVTADGIPTLAIYIFALWLACVIAGARLATLLASAEPQPPPDASQPSPPLPEAATPPSTASPPC